MIKKFPSFPYNYHPMRYALALLALSGLTFATCPSPQAVLKAVKSLGVPIKEVKKVEPYKEIPVLCRAVGVLEKNGATAEVDFYTTADGKYFLPFVGKVVYEPSGVEGIKRVKIVSVRNPNHSFTLGYVTNDLKYYFPEMLPLPEVKETSEGKEATPVVKEKPQEAKAEKETSEVKEKTEKPQGEKDKR